MSGQTLAQLVAAVDRMNVGKSTLYVGASWREVDMFLRTIHDMGMRVDVFRRAVSSDSGGWIRFSTIESMPHDYQGYRAVIVFDHHAESVMNQRVNPRDAAWIHAQTMHRRFE